MHLVAVGKRMPGWIADGFTEYQKRLSGNITLELREVAACAKKHAGGPEEVRAREEKNLRSGIPPGAWVVALDRHGKAWDTLTLVACMRDWQSKARDIAFVVGGPEGLSPEFIESADQIWSLSPLTLPHALVRVVVAEQLYRAWSVINHHPYHRE